MAGELGGGGEGHWNTFGFSTPGLNWMIFSEKNNLFLFVK